jgi:hypothetical protein
MLGCRGRRGDRNAENDCNRKYDPCYHEYTLRFMPRDAECSYGKDPWMMLIIPWLGFTGPHCHDQIITKCQGGVQECILACLIRVRPMEPNPTE